MSKHMAKAIDSGPSTYKIRGRDSAFFVILKFWHVYVMYSIKLNYVTFCNSVLVLPLQKGWETSDSEMSASEGELEHKRRLLLQELEGSK